VAKKSTFRLNLPRDVAVEVYRVQLADGTIVTRQLDEVEVAPATPPGVTNG
jgi:hypothetical protein